MSQENVELVHRAREAFNRRDFRALAELTHDDLEFVSVLTAVDAGEGTYRGPFDLFHPAYEYVRDVGDSVLAMGKLRVRGKGSGVDVEVPSALVLTYRDGKCVRFQEFGERRDALEAVGLSEQDAQT